MRSETGAGRPLRFFDVVSGDAEKILFAEEGTRGGEIFMSEGLGKRAFNVNISLQIWMPREIYPPYGSDFRTISPDCQGKNAVSGFTGPTAAKDALFAVRAGF